MRDINIQKSFTREINLNTKVVSSKKKFTRKEKYKKKYNYKVAY